MTFLLFKWKIGIFIPKNELVVAKTKQKKINPALWGKTDYKNANTVSKIEDPTRIFLHNGLKSILSMECFLPDQNIHMIKIEKISGENVEVIWSQKVTILPKKMCQITILSIFSLGAQDSDLVHFLEMEKLSEIKPPLGACR